MTLLGIDVGGTFTDVVAVDDSGGLYVEKVSSTPDDPAEGLISGVEAVNVPLEDITRFVHGTTVATNAVLEREGANCALLATDGFQDVLEIGWRDRPNLWGLEFKYESIIEREHCYGITERTTPDGEVLTDVSESDIQTAVEELLETDVESIVVSFLHSYANPENEKKAVEILKEVWPNEYITASSQVLPESREFERTSTSAMTAYTRPIIASYLERVEEKLAEKGYEEEFFIIQSNGGLAPADVTKRRSAHTVLSGPAGGAAAASYIAEQTGRSSVISCDMGGTSFDISLLPGGELTMTQETELDYQLPIRFPMADIRTIGAGGGSIAWVDEGGILHTGPQSAGANPGPICYDHGGEKMTITDANLLLGRINPENSIGEDIDLNLEHTREVVKSTIGAQLDLSYEEVGQAVIDVGVDKMVGEIRETSVGQGYDPRNFTMVVFGGAGPLHAGEFVKNSDVPTAIIPRYPGVLSALGGIIADERHDFVRSINGNLERMDVNEFHSKIRELVNESRKIVSSENLSVGTINTIIRCDMKYHGQSHSITVQIPSRTPNRAELRSRFREAYLNHYSEEGDSEIFVDNVQVSVVLERQDFDLASYIRDSAPSADAAVIDSREVYFDDQWKSTPVYDREEVPDQSTLVGPAILEQADTTVVVNPGVQCSFDEYGNAILEEVDDD